jgi:hypothetical protein
LWYIIAQQNSTYKEKAMKMSLILLLLFSFGICAQAQRIPQIAKELNLYGGMKATIQWERIFSSKRHLVKYRLDSLSLETRDELKSYLIQHAADSKQPIVPGL